MPAPASRAPVAICGEAPVVGVVVAEVQRGVAEVGQQVEVGDLGARVEGITAGTPAPAPSRGRRRG